MRVVGLDLETTGLEVEKGHKIIEAALLTYEDGKLADAWVQRINPERPIDPGASSAHGIVYADVAHVCSLVKISKICCACSGGDVSSFSSSCHAAAFPCVTGDTSVPARKLFRGSARRRWR